MTTALHKSAAISTYATNNPAHISFKGLVKSSPVAYLKDTVFECGDVLVSIAVRKKINIINVVNRLISNFDQGTG